MNKKSYDNKLKTALLKQSIPVGYKLIVKTLSNETPDNFMLPKYVVINGEEKATDVPKTWLPVYLPTGDPEMDKALDEKCGKGLLFIDELSRATQQVLNVILPLLNEGEFNGYKVGSGWTIIAASNRPEDDLCGQSDLGNALVNRFSILYFEPKAESWAKWADTQNYMSPILTNWLCTKGQENYSGGKYFYYDPNENENTATTKLMCTPRSWTNACKLLAAYMNTKELNRGKILNVPISTVRLAFNQCLPREAVESFTSYLNLINKVPGLNQLSKDVWKGKAKVIAKTDLRRVAFALATIIIANKTTYPTKTEMENFCAWLVANDSDQFCSYCLDTITATFAGMLDKKTRENLFILNREYKKQSNEDKKLYDNVFKPLCDKWKFKNISEVPDWSEAVGLLAEKYEKSFSEAIVDGKEALA